MAEATLPAIDLQREPAPLLLAVTREGQSGGSEAASSPQLVPIGRRAVDAAFQQWDSPLGDTLAISLLCSSAQRF
jgi:hypothetical protein